MCKGEEKFLFSLTDWQPNHLQYLECGILLYMVLSDHPGGIGFMESDRRGLLVSEVARELESLVDSTRRGELIFNNDCLFNQRNIMQTFTREYFTILGRLTYSNFGQRILDNTLIFQYISSLGRYTSLDYVSRVALTALAFSDGGYISGNLLQIWAMSGGCSDELRRYCLVLLR